MTSRSTIALLVALVGALASPALAADGVLIVQQATSGGKTTNNQVQLEKTRSQVWLEHGYKELQIPPSRELRKTVAPGTDFGTIITGEMFAPVLREQIEKYNVLTGSRFHVLAVPNTYFGGDVSVTGLLTGQDLIKVRDQIVGDFAIIPSSIIKSDEPILLDGMRYEELRSQFPVPIFEFDTQGLINFLTNKKGEPE